MVFFYKVFEHISQQYSCVNVGKYFQTLRENTVFPGEPYFIAILPRPLVFLTKPKINYNDHDGNMLFESQNRKTESKSTDYSGHYNTVNQQPCIIKLFSSADYQKHMLPIDLPPRAL